LYLFAPTAEGVTARMFDSEFGIGEDPATGSAAGPPRAPPPEHGGPGATRAVALPPGEEGDPPGGVHVPGGRGRGARRGRGGGLGGGWGPHRRSGSVRGLRRRLDRVPRREWRHPRRLCPCASASWSCSC